MIEFDEIKKTIDKLRSPDGCPWDKKQTHKSLLPYLYEEANEVGDAIINNDKNHLKEELGDLLLQILLHSKIAEESNDFTIQDVINNLNIKLIRRHPHVFGEETADSAEDVVKLWEDIKTIEKKDINFNSILDKVPKNFQPLLKSYKLQKIASSVGFDWKDYKGVLKKLEEEINELKEAIASNNIDNIEHEFGDILFALVNLGRFINIKADVALVKANSRFIKRFQYIENKIAKENKKFSDFSIDELEKFWQEAKKNI